MSLHKRDMLQRLLDRARRAQDTGDLDKAFQIVHHALGENPGDQRVRLLHAELLLDANQPREALGTLNASLWYRHQERESQAETGKVDATPRSPEDIQTLLLLAETHCRLNRREDACKALMQVLEADAKNTLALRRLAGIHIDTDQHAQAVEYLNRLIEIDPRDRRALSMLAEASEALGKNDQAMRLYQRLQCIVPSGEDDSGPAAAEPRQASTRPSERSTAPVDPAAFRLRIARLKKRAMRYVEAAEEFGDLLREEPGDAELALEASSLDMEMGDDAAVIGKLEVARQANPEKTDPQVLLAEQHMRMGRFGPAGRIWFNLWRHDSRDAHAVAGLIVCAISQQRYPLAGRFLRLLAGLRGSGPRREILTGMWMLATPGLMLEDLLNQSDPSPGKELLPVLLAESSQTLQEQLGNTPGMADLQYHLAVCRKALGENELAAEALDQALGLNGRYLAAVRLRMELLLEQSNLPAAQAMMERIAEGAPELNSRLMDFRLALIILGTGPEAAADALEADQEIEAGAIDALFGQISRLLERAGRSHLFTMFMELCRNHPALRDRMGHSRAA